MATARPGVGRRSKPRATSRTTATRRQASDSDITSESLIHRFGYTAAIAAATSPTRGPARRRPRSPITATVAMPSSVVAKRCHSTLPPLPRLHGVRYSEVSGPCSAPGSSVNASRNQSPSLFRPAWML